MVRFLIKVQGRQYPLLAGFLVRQREVVPHSCGHPDMALQFDSREQAQAVIDALASIDPDVRAHLSVAEVQVGG